MKRTAPPRVRRFPAAKQKRMDRLLEKNSEGTITPKELALLKELVADAEELMADNAKRLAKFAKAAAHGRRNAATPVTVWVRPEPAGR